MQQFKASIKNEIEKLLKRKKTAATLFISLFLILLGQFSIIIVRKNFGLATVSSTQFPIFSLYIFSNILMPLFILLITIGSFCDEFSHNTFKITLTRPVTRFKLYSAKIISIITYIALSLAFVLIVSTICGVAFNSNYSFSDNIVKILLSYIVTIIPLAVICLASVLLSNIFKNGVVVFFVFVLAFIGLKILGVLFPGFSGILLTSQLGWYNLWIMDFIPYFEIIKQFLLMMSYAIIFFTAGYYLFDKKEI